MFEFLVIEDDSVMAQMISHGLTPIGGRITHVDNAEVGLRLAQEKKFDAIVLDLLLPKMDGFTLLQSLRKDDVQTPVLVVSSLAETEPKIKTLQLGGDDFITKPFNALEFQLRIQNLVRRSKSAEMATTSIYGDLRLDRIQRQAYRSNQKIELQEHEFLLLDLLLETPGQIVSKKAILKKVWNYEFDPQTNVVDVLVCRLRNKIDRGYSQKLIHTARGHGYMVQAQGVANAI